MQIKQVGKLPTTSGELRTSPNQKHSPLTSLS